MMYLSSMTSAEPADKMDFLTSFKSSLCPTQIFKNTRNLVIVNSRKSNLLGLAIFQFCQNTIRVLSYKQLMVALLEALAYNLVGENLHNWMIK